MITTLLFRPGLEPADITEAISQLPSGFTVTEQSVLYNWVRGRWDIESENGSFDIALYGRIPEYGITNAVHIDISELTFSGGVSDELTRAAVDYYNTVYTLVEAIQPVFGLGDDDERFEPRHIPSRWQYRDGVFEEAFWLTVFGEGYTNRFGKRTLVDGPAWHAATAGDCVVALVTPNPFLGAEGHRSPGEAQRAFEVYLDEQSQGSS